MTFSHAPTEALEPTGLRAFRAARRAAAASARGPASFVWGDFVTEVDSTIRGAAGLWSPLENGAGGLRVRASAETGIRIGNTLVDGEAVLYADPTEGPTVAYFSDGAEGVIFSYDHSAFALQIWNPNSEWARRFDAIDTFTWDASWKVQSVVTAIEGGRTMAITHHRDPRPIDVPVTAEVAFSGNGVTHTLLATSAGPEEGLFVHFTDSTNGRESYRLGRGLRVTPGHDGHAELDFNYATLLPCSFSLAWNCPIPAGENALPIPIRAGEKHAIDANGTPLL